MTNSTLPTDNLWGIPCLDPTLQPYAITQPVLAWGSRARGSANTGTWHFYVDDYRFGAALANPENVARTGCTAACEPNITMRDYTTRAEALWGTFQKRRVAALLQARGVRVFVDLCFPAALTELCMLGVPRGWRAFATRGFAARPDELRAEHELACQWAGRYPLFLVVGGGELIRAVCLELRGAVWCPGHRPKHGQR